MSPIAVCCKYGVIVFHGLPNAIVISLVCFFVFIYFIEINTPDIRIIIKIILLLKTWRTTDYTSRIDKY